MRRKAERAFLALQVEMISVVGAGAGRTSAHNADAEVGTLTIFNQDHDLQP